MQGSLSASYDEITWVLTSYVVMAAIMTAPVGWLATRFGRKNLFIACLIGFTVTSMLCGIAGSLPQMVVYRLLQGAFGAALVPLSQSTMLDIYPPEQRGVAMSIWGMGVMVGPILGPTLGGYLTFDFDWRYVFFVNLPFGIIAVLGLLFLMPKVEPNRGTRFDWTGFLVLSLGLAALQIGLDRGEELDWLSSRSIVICFVLAGLGFYLFVRAYDDGAQHVHSKVDIPGPESCRRADFDALGRHGAARLLGAAGPFPRKSRELSGRNGRAGDGAPRGRDDVRHAGRGPVEQPCGPAFADAVRLYPARLFDLHAGRLDAGGLGILHGD